MAGWNKPNAANQPTVKKGGAKAPSKVKGVVAGLVTVCALGGLCLWMFSGGDDAPKAKPDKERGRIKEVTPSIRTNAVEKTEDPHKGMVEVRGKWYPEYNSKGGHIWIGPNWVKYHSPVVYTNRSNAANIPKEIAIFDNKAERQIAALLATPLGTTILGRIRYDEGFVKQFLESIKTPIIITKDDEPWAAEMKRAMNETKTDLMARYRAGEDIADIMTQTREEMQKLGVYRQQLDYEIRKQVLDAAGDEEQTKAIYDAANQMLAERGLAPLKMPVILKNNLKIDLQRRGE